MYGCLDISIGNFLDFFCSEDAWISGCSNDVISTDYVLHSQCTSFLSFSFSFSLFPPSLFALGFTPTQTHSLAVTVVISSITFHRLITQEISWDVLKAVKCLWATYLTMSWPSPLDIFETLFRWASHRTANKLFNYSINDPWSTLNAFPVPCH